ncbi:MAG: response regulator [Elusimicrobia bacterium]|nr:response regulator [Elusimicrobiota bacterium]
MSGLGKILLVEDDPGDVEMTVEVLKRVAEIANEIVVARDGSEALDYLKKEGAYAGRANGNPIVVLLDIKLPKLDGIEVLREMKRVESLRPVPVVMLTSSREPADLNECYKLSVNAYVVKPVKFEDFFEAVKTVGVFWAMLNERPA